MRLWSIHPKYLDQKGLVALWRETLLAQNVLRGNTRGYKNHPQLNRFKTSGDAKSYIASYLWEIYVEATARGYKFDMSKIPDSIPLSPLTVTEGQLSFEFKHLLGKLKVRDAKRYCELVGSESLPETHKLFIIIPGPIESWERV